MGGGGRGGGGVHLFSLLNFFFLKMAKERKTSFFNFSLDMCFEVHLLSVLLSCPKKSVPYFIVLRKIYNYVRCLPLGKKKIRWAMQLFSSKKKGEIYHNYLWYFLSNISSKREGSVFYLSLVIRRGAHIAMSSTVQ